MSDNLLGHSPMARPAPSSGGTSSGAPDARVAGGVWAQTSAKRDKLGELKLELDWDKGHRTLDDVATEEQRWDLRLADGMKLAARATDGAWDTITAGDRAAAEGTAGEEASEAEVGGAADLSETTTASDVSSLDIPGLSSKSHPLLVDLDGWLTSTESKREKDAMLTRAQFEAHLSEVIRILSPEAGDAASPGPIEVLRHLRDFAVYDPDPDASSGEEGGSNGRYAPPKDVDADLRRAEDPFDDCVARLRLLLTRCAADHLLSSWDGLTTPSDADVDRAAVRGEAAEPRSALPLVLVNAVLRSYAFGTCRNRLGAWWDLADADADGRLEQIEMDAAVYRSLKPAEDALREAFAEALEAAPVRDAPPTWEEEEKALSMAPEVRALTEPKKGWRQRRREKKEKKRLTKMFDRTLANHFDVEVEMPHRLRCVYAWANKAHQDGKIDNVLVDSGGTVGRKRYVELQPKISLSEFEEVQGEHFAHINRAGEELLSSFREDLLVEQGKGRQNRELRRDTFLFLAGVSLIDFGILML